MQKLWTTQCIELSYWSICLHQKAWTIFQYLQCFHFHFSSQVLHLKTFSSATVLTLIIFFPSRSFWFVFLDCLQMCFTRALHSHTPSVSSLKKAILHLVTFSPDDELWWYSIHQVWRKVKVGLSPLPKHHPYIGIIYVQYYAPQLLLRAAFALTVQGRFYDPITRCYTLSGSGVILQFKILYKYSS